MSKRIYLAGPEVFLLNAKEIGKRKKALCRKYGFEGVFPLDVEVDAGGQQNLHNYFRRFSIYHQGR